MGTWLPRAVVLALLLILARAHAGAEESTREIPAHEREATRTLVALEAGDAAVLAGIASARDPDPWLVADVLCARGETRAAAALAAASTLPDRDALVAYVARPCARETSQELRQAFEKMEAARRRDAWQDVLEAVRALDVPVDRVVGIRIELSRGLALVQLVRREEALTPLGRAAVAARELGWLRAAVFAYEYWGHAAYAHGRLEAAAHAWSAQRALAESLGDDALLALVLGNLGQVESQRGRFPQATAALEQALGLLDESGDRAGRARVLLVLGGVHVRQGRYREALATQQQALEIYRALEDARGEIMALGNLGYVLERLGDYREALAIQQRLLERVEELGEPALRVRVLQNLGVLHVRFGEYEQALALLSQARELCEALQDKAGLGRTLNDLAVAHQRRGDFHAALAILEQALALKVEMGDMAGAAQTLGNIGTVQLEFGDAPKALETQQEALRRFQHLGDLAGVATAHANLGEVHAILGDLGRALREKQKALDLLERIGDKGGAAHTRVTMGGLEIDMGAIARGLRTLEQGRRELAALEDMEGLAHAATRIALAYLELGDHERALAAYEEVLLQREALQDHSGQARALLALGYVQEQLGRVEQALRTLERARAKSEAIDDRIGVVACGASLGEVLQRQGRPKQALEQLLPALELAEACAARSEAARILATLGLTCRDLGRPAEAIAHLDRAVREAERLRAGPLLVRSIGSLARVRLQEGDAGRAFAEVQRATPFVEDMLVGLGDEEGALARAQFSDVFGVGVLAALKLGEVAGAFGFLEQGRAGALLYSLGGRHLLRWEDLPTELREAEAHARAQVRKRQSEHALAVETRVLAAIRPAVAALDRARAHLREIALRIEREARHEAGLLYPRAATLEEVQAVVPSGTALVLYGLCLDRAVALVVDAKRAVPRDLGDAAALRALCEELDRALEAGEAGEAADVLARARSFLVEPLKLGEDIRQVLVSPDGPLCYLPFGALFSDRVVALIPSATTYVELVSSPESPGEEVLSLGRPAYGSKARGDGDVLFRGLEALEDLKASGEEARTVGDVVLLGEQATKAGLQALLERARRWRAVHLACHGLVDRERPSLSALALTATDEDDGMLTGHEVLRMRIPADLVVLSACRSARGRVVAGEGMVGFTRAFMYAGAPRVLCSLWKVEDRATRVLMERFYELWNPEEGARLGAAEALHLAQAHVRAQEEFRHPRYWAAWVLWGLPD